MQDMHAWLYAVAWIAHRAAVEQRPRIGHARIRPHRIVHGAFNRPQSALSNRRPLVAAAAAVVVAVVAVAAVVAVVGAAATVAVVVGPRRPTNRRLVVALRAVRCFTRRTCAHVHADERERKKTPTRIKRIFNEPVVLNRVHQLRVGDEKTTEHSKLSREKKNDHQKKRTCRPRANRVTRRRVQLERNGFLSLSLSLR